MSTTAASCNSNSVAASMEAVVELATVDYLECLGVEEYFSRCLKKRIKHFNTTTRESIIRMKTLAGRNDPERDAIEMEECMQKTFKLRYRDVMHHRLSVKNAVDIYPGLRDFQELRREFERVTGKSVLAFERHLNCVLKQYAKDQISRKFYTCTSSYCRDSLEIIRRDEKHHARKTAARIIIYSCAQSQRTWWDVIFKVFGESENGIGRPHPTVMVHGTPFAQNCADVYCEQIKILAGVNFYEAILSCYFLYYIFNLNYPEVDAETYQPFDNVMNLMAPVKEKESVKSSSE